MGVSSTAYKTKKFCKRLNVVQGYSKYIY